MLVIVGSMDAQGRRESRRRPSLAPGQVAPYLDAAGSVAHARGATAVELPGDLVFDAAAQESIAEAVAKAIGPVH